MQMKVLRTYALLLLFALVFASGVQAATPGRQDAPQTRIYFDNYSTHQVVTDDGIGLNMLELLGSDGKPMTDAPPVILVHGFTQNWNTWYDVGDKLRRQGFRVFIPNWRGHGQGATKSLGVTGDRSVNDPRLTFDNLPAFDVPAILNFVSRLTNHKKILYMAHSMGAMMMHLALGGVMRGPNGQMMISIERQQEIASKLKAFISIGAPLDFADAKGLNDFALESILSMTGIKLDQSTPSLLSTKTEIPFLNMMNQAREDYLFHMEQTVGLMSGLLNLRNLNRLAYGIQKEYLGSDVPRPFQNSVKFNRTGYASADGQIDYAKISLGTAENHEHAQIVPTLLVSADKDVLAPLEDQVLGAKNKNLPHLIYKNTGHIDLVIGHNVDNLVANTMHFSKIVQPECRDLFSQNY